VSDRRGGGKNIEQTIMFVSFEKSIEVCNENIIIIKIKEKNVNFKEYQDSM